MNGIDAYTAAKKVYDKILLEVIRTAGTTTPGSADGYYQPVDAIELVRATLHQQIDVAADDAILCYPARLGPGRLVVPTYAELYRAVRRG